MRCGTRKHVLMFVVPALIPAFVYLFLHVQSKQVIEKLVSGEDVLITEIARTATGRGSRTSIYATVGDIFEPNYRGRFRAYDAILISALLDPIYQDGKYPIIETNFLLSSLVRKLDQDTSGNSAFLLGLFSRLEAVQRGSAEENVCEIPIRDDYARSDDSIGELLLNRCYPFMVPVNGAGTLRREGIKKVYVLPLFISKNQRASERGKQLLSHNLRVNTERIFFEDLGANISGVAIPALAGSYGRIDSNYYLSYFESFAGIVDGVSRGLSSGNSRVSRVYLVAYGGLPQAELRVALSALVNVKRNLMFWSVCLAGGILSTAFAFLGFSFLGNRHSVRPLKVVRFVLPHVMAFVVLEALSIYLLGKQLLPQSAELSFSFPVQILVLILAGLISASLGYALSAIRVNR